MHKGFFVRWGVLFLSMISIVYVPFYAKSIKNRSNRNEKCFTYTFSHHVVPEKVAKKNVYYWLQKSENFPFDEFILSWNALRPRSGKYAFSVRLKADRGWTSWLKVAEWGARVQHSYCNKDAQASVNVDIVSMAAKKKAVTFEVKVEAIGEASIEGVHWLHACISDMQKFSITRPSRDLPSGVIEGVPLQSQMVLDHVRASELCSPTSMSVALSYVLSCAYKDVNDASNKMVIDPIDFAELVRDDIFNIYGNWVLNVAAAYDISGGKIPCRVERIPNFNYLYDYLKQNIPVVVSIRGPIKGGAKPYKHGHLMVVIGWDAKNRKVLCIDPAFPSTNATRVCYTIKSFLDAWGLRRNLAYHLMPGMANV